MNVLNLSRHVQVRDEHDHRATAIGPDRCLRDLVFLHAPGGQVDVRRARRTKTAVAVSSAQHAGPAGPRPRGPELTSCGWLSAHGSPRIVETDLAVTAPGGRIVLFGNAGGGEQVPLPSTGRLIGGNLAIGGFSIRRLWATAPHRASSGLRRVLDLITQGRLDIAITEVGSLAEVPAVHQLLAEGRGDGKYVAHPQG